MRLRNGRFGMTQREQRSPSRDTCSCARPGSSRAAASSLASRGKRASRSRSLLRLRRPWGARAQWRHSDRGRRIVGPGQRGRGGAAAEATLHRQPSVLAQRGAGLAFGEQEDCASRLRTALRCAACEARPPTAATRPARGLRRTRDPRIARRPGVGADRRVWTSKRVRTRTIARVANQASRVGPADACFRDCIGAAWQPLTVAPMLRRGTRCVCGTACSRSSARRWASTGSLGRG